MERRLSDLGASWREKLLEELWDGVTRTWDPTYDRDARSMIDQALSRLLTAMTKAGSLPLSAAIYDGEVRLGPIDVAHVKGRGDFRYRSDNLASYLTRNPDRDLVPIVCSTTSKGGHLVLDGHHRLRAYVAAGRSKIPAVVISIRSGNGLITV